MSHQELTLSQARKKIAERKESLAFWLDFLKKEVRTVHDYERARYLNRYSISCILCLFPGTLMSFDQWPDDPFLRVHVTRINRALEARDINKLNAALVRLNVYINFTDDEL